MKALLLVLSLIITAQAGASVFPAEKTGLMSQMPYGKSLNQAQIQRIYNVLLNAKLANLTSARGNRCELTIAQILQSDKIEGLVLELTSDSVQDFRIRTHNMYNYSNYFMRENLSEGISQVQFETPITEFRNTTSDGRTNIQPATKSVLIVKYNEANSTIVGIGIFIVNESNDQEIVISSNSCSIKK